MATDESEDPPAAADASEPEAQPDDGGDVAGRDPDEIAREIEQTRAELADTIDAIADRISPKRAASRGAQAVKAQVSSARDKVAGGGAAVSAAGSSSTLDGDAATPSGLVNEAVGSTMPVGPIVAVAAAFLLIAVIWRRRRSR